MVFCPTYVNRFYDIFSRPITKLCNFHPFLGENTYFYNIFFPCNLKVVNRICWDDALEFNSHWSSFFWWWQKKLCGTPFLTWLMEDDFSVTRLQAGVKSFHQKYRLIQQHLHKKIRSYVCQSFSMLNLSVRQKRHRKTTLSRSRWG